MARKITVQAFEEWIADERNVEDVLQRIAGGLTLQRASVAVKKPFTCLHGFFHSTPERAARYDAARKSWADRQMDEAMELADGVAPDRDHVAKVKLQVEVRHNQAKAYHKDRWGDRVQVEKSVSVTVDAGPATRLLREMQREELAELEVAEVVPALENHGQPAG